MNEQICLFEDKSETPPECCYNCKHFSEFKEPRQYTNKEGDFGVFGICFKRFCKNGSFSAFPIYIPNGKCNDYLKGNNKKC